VLQNVGGYGREQGYSVQELFVYFSLFAASGECRKCFGRDNTIVISEWRQSSFLMEMLLVVANRRWK
jgi:hypothetical protein